MQVRLWFPERQLMGFGPERIEFITDRPGHDRRYAIDAKKIMALGWPRASSLL